MTNDARVRSHPHPPTHARTWTENTENTRYFSSRCCKLFSSLVHLGLSSSLRTPFSFPLSLPALFSSPPHYGFLPFPLTLTGVHSLSVTFDHCHRLPSFLFSDFMCFSVLARFFFFFHLLLNNVQFSHFVLSLFCSFCGARFCVRIRWKVRAPLHAFRCRCSPLLCASHLPRHSKLDLPVAQARRVICTGRGIRSGQFHHTPCLSVLLGNLSPLQLCLFNVSFHSLWQYKTQRGGDKNG